MCRHLATQWNQERRYQGHRDIDLHEDSKAYLQQHTLAPSFVECELFSSPLLRSQRFFQLTTTKAYTLDQRLIEMSYGEWEGKTAEEVRRDLPEQAPQQDWSGLDFAPKSGESSRQVQQRILDFLQHPPQKFSKAFIVCHKGVLMATYALATDWKILSPPPHKIDWNKMFVFEFDGQHLSLADWNIKLPLTPKLPT